MSALSLCLPPSLSLYLYPSHSLSPSLALLCCLPSLTLCPSSLSLLALSGPLSRTLSLSHVVSVPQPFLLCSMMEPFFQSDSAPSKILHFSSQDFSASASWGWRHLSHFSAVVVFLFLLIAERCFSPPSEVAIQWPVL